MGYGRCKIVDADNPDRVIAFNEGQGAIIGTPPEGLEKMDVSGTELVIEDSPDLPPLWEAFGASRRATATGCCPSSAWSWRHPTPPCTSDRSTSCSRPPRSIWPPSWRHQKLQVQSWHVMFMARGKVGPFRVEGTAHAGGRAGRGAHADPRRGQRRPGDHVGFSYFRRSELKLRCLLSPLGVR